jgi:hypothetical protein
VTEPRAKPGCAVLLFFGLAELIGAIAFGYLVYLIALPMIGDRNAVPTALLLSPIGAYIVDRWAKRVLGESLLKAILEPFAGFP